MNQRSTYKICSRKHDSRASRNFQRTFHRWSVPRVWTKIRGAFPFTVIRFRTQYIMGTCMDSLCTPGIRAALHFALSCARRSAFSRWSLRDFLLDFFMDGKPPVTYLYVYHSLWCSQRLSNISFYLEHIL